ncbi:HU family DNA-binding protein [Moraxella bovoculi]|uniref:HU family DNA-binding protein n=1 Tax=Moraxella bovoculi TaxID=386891 RepID=UPI0006245C36|nr:HU family DNA-binding protein [Moraxella bovoculi]AKG11482.1 transcriptional regulator HU subunit alpha [Moraxella bovoculi]
MNKQELITAISDKTGLTKAQSKAALDATLTVITDTLTQGDEVALVGFGSFAIKTHRKRMGRNPKTGESLTIPAKKAIAFKAGKGLKDAVN